MGEPYECQECGSDHGLPHVETLSDQLMNEANNTRRGHPINDYARSKMREASGELQRLESIIASRDAEIAQLKADAHFYRAQYAEAVKAAGAFQCGGPLDNLLPLGASILSDGPKAAAAEITRLRALLLTQAQEVWVSAATIAGEYAAQMWAVAESRRDQGMFEAAYQHEAAREACKVVAAQLRSRIPPSIGGETKQDFGKETSS